MVASDHSCADSASRGLHRAYRDTKVNKALLVGLLAGAIGLTGCVDLLCPTRCSGHSQHSTSLVDFLYPDGRVPPPPTSPQLTIPLRVGLAFLPSANDQNSGLDEAHKQLLLERIKQRFSSRRFVSEIVIVPDYYLAGRRGFGGLESVKRLYDLDVVALVSFDQQTNLDQNTWSLAYLTIVGAYVVKGSRHDVATLVDLAVVDPQSRQLVIRAGGTDLRHGNTTLIDASRQIREADVAGLSGATDQMLDHFDAALTKFEADVRSGTAGIRVVSKNAPGASRGGGGALDMACLGALLAALAQCVDSKRREVIL
jgi:rhombotail lipoprotein